MSCAEHNRENLLIKEVNSCVNSLKSNTYKPSHLSLPEYNQQKDFLEGLFETIVDNKKSKTIFNTENNSDGEHSTIFNNPSTCSGIRQDSCNITGSAKSNSSSCDGVVQSTSEGLSDVLEREPLCTFNDEAYDLNLLENILHNKSCDSEIFNGCLGRIQSLKQESKSVNLHINLKVPSINSKSGSSIITRNYRLENLPNNCKLKIKINGVPKAGVQLTNNKITQLNNITDDNVELIYESDGREESVRDVTSNYTKNKQNELPLLTEGALKKFDQHLKHLEQNCVEEESKMKETTSKDLDCLSQNINGSKINTKNNYILLRTNLGDDSDEPDSSSEYVSISNQNSKNLSNDSIETRKENDKAIQTKEDYKKQEVNNEDINIVKLGMWLEIITNTEYNTYNKNFITSPRLPEIKKCRTKENEFAFKQFLESFNLNHDNVNNIPFENAKILNNKSGKVFDIKTINSLSTDKELHYNTDTKNLVKTELNDKKAVQCATPNQVPFTKNECQDKTELNDVKNPDAISSQEYTSKNENVHYAKYSYRKVHGLLRYLFPSGRQNSSLKKEQKNSWIRMNPFAFCYVSNSVPQSFSSGCTSRQKSFLGSEYQTYIKPDTHFQKWDPLNSFQTDSPYLKERLADTNYSKGIVDYGMDNIHNGRPAYPYDTIPVMQCPGGCDYCNPRDEMESINLNCTD